MPELMAANTKNGELGREMDELREQVRAQGAKHEDALDEIR